MNELRFASQPSLACVSFGQAYASGFASFGLKTGLTGVAGSGALKLMTSKWVNRAGYAVLAVALIVRAASVLISPVSYRLYSDMGNYVNYADQLLAGVWTPYQFFQPIGFPLILYLFKLAFTRWDLAFGVFQSVLATAALWFMWKAASRSFGPTIGLASLIVGAFHAQWLAFNLFALSENILLFLLALLLWISQRVVARDSILWSAAWGLVFIAAFWIKGTHIFLGPLFLLGVLFWKRWSVSALGRVAVPICLVVATGLLAHGLLTYRTIGTFQLGPSAGGLNFVAGKCPSKNNMDISGGSWHSPLHVQLGLDEKRQWTRPFTDSSYFMKEGLKCIQANPLVLVQSFESIPLLFIGNFSWPPVGSFLRDWARLYELLFSIVLLVGLTVWLRTCFPITTAKCPDMLVWVAPIIALFLCVYVFNSEIRFRVPFDVYFIPLAVKGWAVLLSMKNAAPTEPAAEFVRA